MIRDIHVELLRRMDLTGDSARAAMASDDEYLLRLERTLDNIARGREELANAIRRSSPTSPATACAIGCWRI